ncbi:MAG: mannose-6-phosphate isomerase-like protein (cupin superfamily) [Arenicella sp.]|jgi:mannose-6-phosphate isomerase-like protein (cupin superfamily)
MTRAPETYFKEGCFIEEWHNHVHDRDCSIARVRVEVGKTTKLHALQKTTERYVMLSGSALVTVGEKCWRVAEGDVVVIKPDEAQKIQNQSQEDLIFLAICTPRFLVENYREI